MDSVDVERMEEAKMELMRTVKCPDNQVNINSMCNIVSCTHSMFPFALSTGSSDIDIRE